MATLAEKIKNILRPFKRIRKEIGAVKSEIADTIKAGRFDNITQVDNITQAIAFERFYHNQTMCDCESINFSKNHFVLFDYPYYNVVAWGNLGDHIQSIATKNAIDSIYKGANYEYFGRDYLAYYNGSQNTGGGAIVQITNRT